MKSRWGFKFELDSDLWDSEKSRLSGLMRDEWGEKDFDLLLDKCVEDFDGR